MKKAFLPIGFIILIIIIFFIILSTNSKEQSLTGDILKDINFSKTQANTLITEKDKIYKIKEKEEKVI